MIWKIYVFLSLQCCNHVANSKQPVSKRKEAQKLAQTVWASIQAKYSKQDSKASEKRLAALENAFGSLEIKSN